MSEASFIIPTTDGKAAIYGAVRNVANPKAMVVYVHGLTGGMNVALPVMFSRVLERAGYAFARFDLYGYEDDQRNLIETTTQHNADDLQAVIEHVNAELALPVVAIAHSLGSYAVLLSDPTLFDAVVLWDPTGDHYSETGLPDKAEWSPELRSWILRWGVDHLWGTEVADQMKTVRPFESAKAITCPALIVSAGGGILGESNERFYEALGGQKKLVTIRGANHNFCNDDAPERLFEVTLDWIESRDR